jgi:hypothetical protein
MSIVPVNFRGEDADASAPRSVSPRHFSTRLVALCPDPARRQLDRAGDVSEPAISPLPRSLRTAVPLFSDDSSRVGSTVHLPKRSRRSRSGGYSIYGSCTDEKSQVQALDRSQPVLPMVPDAGTTQPRRRPPRGDQLGGATRTSALGALVVLGVSFEFVAVIGEGRRHHREPARTPRWCSGACHGAGRYRLIAADSSSTTRSHKKGDSSPAGQYPASQICEVEGIPPCRYVAGC